MLVFILRRLLLMVPTTVGVALVVFTIYHLAPGDPATVMMGGGGAGGGLGQDSDVEAKIDNFRRKHGLDRHVVVQFLDYTGPFNLSRDGHSWFSSPFTERKVEEVDVGGPPPELGPDGRPLRVDPSSGARIGPPREAVREGTPLRIDYLPGTPDDDRNAMDVLRGALTDDAAGDAEWQRAADDLVARGDRGLPALFTALYDLRLESSSRADAIERVSGVLTRSTGYTPRPHEARVEKLGAGALIRDWFRWYYEDGGGGRVTNTGENPWGGLLCFELGDEMQAKTPVAAELIKRLKVTVPLSLIATLLSYLIALPLGIFSVQKRGTRTDAVMTVVLFILYSIPTFWAGLMLIQVFGKTGVDLLPVLGLHDKDADSLSGVAYLWDLVLHCILPIATMTYVSLAYLSRQMRAGMMDVIHQDYIRTARAKGLSENTVVYKHALRNSMIPVLTLLASILPILIGGSIIVETVFNIPGMGKYAFEGLLRRDFNIVMATTVFVGIMTQFGILLSDITYSLADPRIRYD